MRPRLQIEHLESRDLPSGGLPGVNLGRATLDVLLQSAAVRLIETTDTRITRGPVIGPTILPGLVDLPAPIRQARRWDKVLVGTWYVPPANMLAYLVGPAAVKPLAIADQTIFHITRAHNGAFFGFCSVQLAKPTPRGVVTAAPTCFIIEGLVTPRGHIRIKFTPTDSQDSPVTGIGTMEWVNHAWRMTMQMASSGSPKVVHWAYMTKLPPGGRPPQPVVQPSDGLPASDQGRWLLGTRWLIEDTSGITGAGPGLVEVVGYRKGYFLGRGLGQSNFSVFGSVTPEGRLFLILLSPDGTTVTRTGTMNRIGRWGMMQFRSYEGTPGLGFAWLVGENGGRPHHNRL